MRNYIGFEITRVVESEPEENMLNTVPAKLDELRWLMMLLYGAKGGYTISCIQW
ncbi:hypothetical protein [Lutispora sp.]|uniref:hypothetical protein n=1 Tax=Lutispora sp. TaxID=2828727 RepID=UPI00356B166B